MFSSLPFAGLIGSFALIATVVTAEESSTSSHSKFIDSGVAVYQQHCASCHSVKGKGAPNWNTLNEHGELPAPPHGSDGHTWRHADEVLTRMIRQGWRDPFNKTSRLTMPAFKGVLTPKETHAVIAYLKTLWSEKQRQFQQQQNVRRSQ